MAFSADKIRQGAAGQGGDYELEQSLKFNDDDTAYLTRTFTSGNRQAMSLSFWFKRGTLGTTQIIFCATISSGGSNNDNNFFAVRFESNDKIAVVGYDTAWLTTKQVFRDPSAWYHCLLEVNSTSGSSYNRCKMAINGTYLATGDITTSYPAENHNHSFNVSGNHCNISSRTGWLGDGYFDGYLAEMHYIDGSTAYDQTHFGETGDYGEWKPIEVTAITEYGTNGFYLPFKPDYTVEGFSTVTYRGTGATQYIGGVGFQPDFTWLKARDVADVHALFDSVRGANKRLYSQANNAEMTGSNQLDSWSTDGFTLGADGAEQVNMNTKSYVAWNWDMGGSNASNTDGSITSTVRANTTYGQSIVSYTGTGANATVGHGLSSAPEMIITKNRDSAIDSVIYHSGTSANPQNEALSLSTTSGNSDYHWWNDTAPTSSVFNLGNANTNNSSAKFIAYCFHSVTGYSKIGSYTGTGSSSLAVTTGFKPAFVIVKSTGTGEWLLWDDTMKTGSSDSEALYPSTSGASSDWPSSQFSFTSTGFTVGRQGFSDNYNNNTSSQKYIYMAFADKREYAYWLDQSGKNNDFTSNNLTESDISVDSPTNNFNVNNPLDEDYASNRVFSEGNLKVDSPTTNHGNTRGTIGMNSGKWYMEWNLPTATGGSNALWAGVCSSDNDLTAFRSVNQWNNHASNSNAIVRDGVSHDWSDGGVAAGTIWQAAIDMDNKKIWLGENNTWWGDDHDTDGNPSTAANPTATFVDADIPDGNLYSYTGGYDLEIISNYGQDSSFAGTKTAQGNSDSGGIGDFYYTPPSGFKALCTKNLPNVDVVPSEHFDVALYTGDSSVQSITSLGFQPSFTWIKERSDTAPNQLFDAVRGVTKNLASNANSAETTNDDTLTHFLSNGFTTGDDNRTNSNGETYVSWNWKANGSGSSNTDGSITSTVSANVDAGFSIVSYTNPSNGIVTVGHGLSKAPEFMIIKDRSSANEWIAWATPLTPNKSLFLDTPGAERDSADFFNDTAPTATVFTLAAGGTNWFVGGATAIAYAFHSVDGYSKVGSYTGNGNADGTFIYTGFRPAYMMIKRTDGAASWSVHDTERDTYNVTQENLYPNLTASEETQATWQYDILSNGIKLIGTSAEINGSGNSYIYIAFAETPFKYSNAR